MMDGKIWVDAILVPKGAEYRAVCKGLSRVNSLTPPVFAIPMGMLGLSGYLEDWYETGFFSGYPQPRVLLMGLCGSLLPKYNVGDVVLYHSCAYSLDEGNLAVLGCDVGLTGMLEKKLSGRVCTGVGYSSNRMISEAGEKRGLGEVYGVDVVDMEGFEVNQVLSRLGVAVGMVRVVSDDTRHDIPDLTGVLNSEGSLVALPLAIALLRQPIAASRLIWGGIKGLQVLEDVTTSLFRL
jgi:hypothetical protein